jgi:Skp family chaperone for outer membrane proteins
MNRLIKHIGVILLILLTWQVHADKACVIDWDTVITQSKQYKDFMSRWNDEKSKHQKKIEFYEGQISKLDKELMKNGLKSEDMKRIKQQIGSHEVKIQRLTETAKVYLDELYAKTLSVLKQTVNKIVSDYASANNIQLVMYKSQLVYVNPEIDITNIIIKELDKLS